MKNIIKQINWLSALQLAVVAGFTVLTVAAVVPHHEANAQLINTFQQCPGGGVRCGDTNLQSIFKVIINWALGIAFALAVLYLIYGGFLYITSAGNEESATKGKNAVVYALIGMVIIILSFVIVNVVVNLVSTGSSGGLFGNTGP